MRSILEPNVMHLKTAPDAVIELMSCRCKTGKCKGCNWSCRRAGLLCTEMCICEGLEDICLNTEVIFIEEDDVIDDEYDEKFVNHTVLLMN